MSADGIYTITGDDTLTLFGRVITNLATASVLTIEYANDIAGMRTGKNKNTIFAKNETGYNASLTLRMMRGSSDDRFLQAQMDAQKKDFAATTLCNGSFVKRLGDGAGNVINDVYLLSAGIFQKNVPSMENVEGDIDQGVATYVMMFASADRAIQ